MNLAVTFSIATFFDRVRTTDFLGGPLPVPSVASVDLFAFVVAVASFVALWRLKVNILWVVAGSAVAGVLMVWMG